MDTRAISDIAEDSLVHQPLQLIGHRLRLHADSLRQRRNRKAGPSHQGVQQAQARDVRQHLECPFEPTRLH